MNPAGLRLLAKILEMTNSPSDNEAMVAMKKANELLKRNRWSWQLILDSRQRSRHIQSQTLTQIDTLLTVIERPSTRKFITGLKTYLLKNVALTDKQQAVLDSLWEQHRASKWSSHIE